MSFHEHIHSILISLTCFFFPSSPISQPGRSPTGWLSSSCRQGVSWAAVERLPATLGCHVEQPPWWTHRSSAPCGPWACQWSGIPSTGLLADHSHSTLWLHAYGVAQAALLDPYSGGLVDRGAVFNGWPYLAHIQIEQLVPLNLESHRWYSLHCFLLYLSSIASIWVATPGSVPKVSTTRRNLSTDSSSFPSCVDKEAKVTQSFGGLTTRSWVFLLLIFMPMSEARLESSSKSNPRARWENFLVVYLVVMWRAALSRFTASKKVVSLT